MFNSNNYTCQRRQTAFRVFWAWFRERHGKLSSPVTCFCPHPQVGNTVWAEIWTCCVCVCGHLIQSHTSACTWPALSAGRGQASVPPHPSHCHPHSRVLTHTNTIQKQGEAVHSWGTFMPLTPCSPAIDHLQKWQADLWHGCPYIDKSMETICFPFLQKCC